MLGHLDTYYRADSEAHSTEKGVQGCAPPPADQPGVCPSGTYRWQGGKQCASMMEVLFLFFLFFFSEVF